MSGEQQQEGESPTHDCDFLTVFLLATDFNENLNYIHFLRLATIIKMRCDSLSLQESSAEGTCWTDVGGIKETVEDWRITLRGAATRVDLHERLGKTRVKSSNLVCVWKCPSTALIMVLLLLIDVCVCVCDTPWGP